MTLTPELLSELKNKLINEKARIENEIGRIAKPTLSDEHATVFNEIGSSEDENASEVEEYTDNLAIENTLEKQLKEIDDALESLENGTYGKCQNCGSEIPTERLLAYPSAKTCLNCQ